jgi:tetratricopeptide (TPR) repeat protein
MLTLKPIRPWHYSLRCLAVLAIGFCLQSASVHAADAGIEWDTLNREVKDLYRAGHYDQAIVVAKKALEVAEHHVGPHHPDVAISLNNLAALYRAMQRDAEATLLEQRAAAIQAMRR